MTSTSIDYAIDNLLAMIRALPACAPPVVVYDGFPGPTEEDNVVMVGGTPDPTSNGPQDWAGLGDRARDEYFDLEGVISCWVGGDDAEGATGFDDAQKTARDRAFAILRAIGDQLRVDPTVGGTPNVLWAGIRNIKLDQTNATDENVATGRVAEIRFTVHFRCYLPGI